MVEVELKKVVISSIDRAGNESDPKLINFE